jgi:hypothetical protein
LLLAFAIFLVFTFALLKRRKVFGRRDWAVTIVLVCVISLFIAYVSLSTVWVPKPLSLDVLAAGRNSLGESEGAFPWSKLSYPLYLSVYHTPFEQLTLADGFAHGQVRFSIFFAGVKILAVNGTFSYFAWVYGSMPLYYSIDFLFSNSYDFFCFLLFTFTYFNIVGALLGIISARALHEAVSMRSLSLQQKVSIA